MTQDARKAAEREASTKIPVPVPSPDTVVMLPDHELNNLAGWILQGMYPLQGWATRYIKPATDIGIAEELVSRTFRFHDWLLEYKPDKPQGFQFSWGDSERGGSIVGITPAQAMTRAAILCWALETREALGGETHHAAHEQH